MERPNIITIVDTEFTQQLHGDQLATFSAKLNDLLSYYYATLLPTHGQGLALSYVQRELSWISTTPNRFISNFELITGISGCAQPEVKVPKMKELTTAINVYNRFCLDSWTLALVDSILYTDEIISSAIFRFKLESSPVRSTRALNILRDRNRQNLIAIVWDCLLALQNKLL